MPRRRVYEEEVNRLVQHAAGMAALLLDAKTPDERENAGAHVAEWLGTLAVAVEKDRIARSLFDGWKGKRPRPMT